MNNLIDWDTNKRRWHSKWPDSLTEDSTESIDSSCFLRSETNQCSSSMEMNDVSFGCFSSSTNYSLAAIKYWRSPEETEPVTANVVSSVLDCVSFLNRSENQLKTKFNTKSDSRSTRWFVIERRVRRTHVKVHRRRRQIVLFLFDRLFQGQLLLSIGSCDRVCSRFNMNTKASRLPVTSRRNNMIRFVRRWRWTFNIVRLFGWRFDQRNVFVNCCWNSCWRIVIFQMTQQWFLSFLS